MDNKIYFSNEEIIECLVKNNIQNLIGSGLYGNVYKLNDKQVIKLWNINVRQKYVKNICELLKNYQELQHFVFPSSLVLRDKTEEIIGYIMPYIKGKSIANAFENISITNLLNAILSFQKELITISQEHLRVKDINSGNIIYNNNEFYFIDPDEWHFDLNKKYEEIYKANDIRISSKFLSLFKYNTYLNTFIEKSKVLEELERGYVYSLNFLYEYIIQAKKEIEKYSQEKVEYVHDIKRILQK